MRAGVKVKASRRRAKAWKVAKRLGDWEGFLCSPAHEESRLTPEDLEVAVDGLFWVLVTREIGLAGYEKGLEVWLRIETSV